MIRLRSLKAARLDSDALVTVGVYDGLHRGHQSLIRRLVDRAYSTNRKSVVVTFFPHPDKVLNEASDRYYLTTPDERARLIERMNIDLLVTLPFDAYLQKQPAADFVQLLIEHLNMKELWVGVDFALGFRRQGDIRFLRRLGEKHSFKVKAIELTAADNSDRLIRSSTIRDFVRSGQMQAASDMLGRPYALTGKVVAGDRRGRAIGIPTANIAAWREQIIPANGVYATWALLGEDVFMAPTNIGRRPTFAGNEVTVEAHLLDFNRDIYGEDLTLRFIEKLRPERKFDRLDDLVAQIHADIAASRQILRANPPGLAAFAPR